MAAKEMVTSRLGRTSLANVVRALEHVAQDEPDEYPFVLKAIEEEVGMRLSAVMPEVRIDADRGGEGGGA
jgi:hypothetical protein